MRCIARLALFIAVYVSSCTILSGAVRRGYGPGAAAEALRKYHALIAVACGVVSLGACNLPRILAKKSQEAEWRKWESWNDTPEQF